MQHKYKQVEGQIQNNLLALVISPNILHSHICLPSTFMNFAEYSSCVLINNY